MTRLAGKVGSGINVIPMLPVPVGGIGSETLIRDMMDLDRWIVSTGAGQATGLRPFMSGAYAGTIPAEIPPLNPEEERVIVSTMLTELNEKFCVRLDLSPSFDRSIPPPLTEHNNGRMVFFGGSNLGRIAKAAAENGHKVMDPRL